MDQPKLKIKLDISDWIIEIIGLVFLILMIGFPVFYFDQLPESIPRHYNALGEPDGYSQKNIIWTLPIIGLALYVGLFSLNRYPHLLNYPQEITEDNAARQYKMVTKLVRTLGMLIAASFFYLSYNTIMIGLGSKETLGIYFLPVFLTSTFAAVGVYLYTALKK